MKRSQMKKRLQPPASYPSPPSSALLSISGVKGVMLLHTEFDDASSLPGAHLLLIVFKSMFTTQHHLSGSGIPRLFAIDKTMVSQIELILPIIEIFGQGL